MTKSPLWIAVFFAASIGTVLGGTPMRAAHADEERGKCEAEDRGGHCDDQFPVIEPTHTIAPPPKLAGCSHEVFNAGYRDGLGGQRWQIYAHCRMRIESSRKGCQAYRKDNPSPEDVDALKCCEVGFAKGMDQLYQRMTTTENELDSERAKECRMVLKLGAETGRAYCKAAEDSAEGDVCWPGIKGRYLGCYITGFNTVAQTCGQTKSLLLRQIHEAYDLSGINSYTFAKDAFAPLGLGKDKRHFNFDLDKAAPAQ